MRVAATRTLKMGPESGGSRAPRMSSFARTIIWPVNVVTRRQLRRSTAVVAAVVAAAGLIAAGPAAGSGGHATVRLAYLRTGPQAVSVAGPATTEPNRDWLDYLQAFGVVAGWASLVVIWLQLKSAERAAQEERQERAAREIEIYGTREFRKVLSPA